MQRLGLMGLLIVASILAVANGCFFRTLNKEYCEKNFASLDPSEAQECCDSFPGQCESGGMCASSTDCVSFETPYCREETRACVQCLESAHCTEVKPVCDEQTNTCVECQTHGDCASELCLDSGSCAAADDVIYVSDSTSATANPECSQTMPCQNLVQALAVAPLREYIKVSGAITTTALTTFDAVTVDVYGAPGVSGAPGTTITRNMNGVVLEMKRAAKVNLFDLEINGGPMGDAVELKDNPDTMVSMKQVKVRASNGNGILITDGKLTLIDSEVYNSSLAGVSMVKGALVMKGARVVDNDQDGVKAAMGTIDIQKSLIAGNRGMAGILTTGASMVTIESSVIAANSGSSGGASITGPFSIRNSIIAKNGSGTTTVGGLTLSANINNATFEFNTVADNISNSDVGISCAVPLNFSNSIITGNTIIGCNFTFTLADTLLTGMGNKTGPPVFLSMDAANPSSLMFYRIGATSAAKDSAGLSQVANDIDGDPRPVMGKDMGADELVGP